MSTTSLIQEKLNLEIYTLIWLDSSTDESRETIQAQQYFRTIINNLKIFKHSNECINFIKTISKYDRIILIVSGRLGQETVPQIHQYQQILAIYVYCMNKQKNEEWANRFKKIKHIMVDLGQLINKIRDEQIERQKNKLNELFPIYNFHVNTANHSFIYSYALINCLIQINSFLNDKNDFINICKNQYEGNDNELEILDEFQQNYSPSKALWWYTKQTFIYRLLNKALQIHNIEILLLLRFFIHDIERLLEKNKCTTPIHVYSGQIISNEDFQILKNNIGGCIIMNSFLSANTKQEIQKNFSQIDIFDNYQRILFDIKADPSLENIKPFSNIKNQSYYSNEDETLFMLGSIFRINNIQQEHDGICIIKIELCSENEQELKNILNQKQINDPITYGQIFFDLRKFDDAEKYYKYLLKNLPIDHQDIILYNDLLGNIAKEKGDYVSSLEYFFIARDLKQNILELDHPDIADSYVSIGEIHQKKDDLKRALDSFDKAMKIYKKKFSDDHPKILICLTQIGHVYNKDKKYSKALEYYQKVLAICQKHVSTDQLLLLADSYKNIGDTYVYQKNFDQALDNYQQSLKIYEKLDSTEYFLSGKIQKSIGIIYENKKQYQQARLFYEQAATNFHYILSENDTFFIEIQQDIQRVSAKIK